MREHVLGAVVAALLLVAGCTAGDDGSSTVADTAPSEGTAAPVDEAFVGRAPGVTDDTIRVGVTYLDLEAIAEVVDLEHGDYEASYQALIDDLNERGGINGRQIEAVYAPVSPIGTDSADQACLELSQDEQVFAIIGYFQADAVLCPVDTQQTAVIGGAMTPERLARARAPWFTVDPGSDLDQESIRRLADAGELDGELGVVAIIQGEAALREEAEPLLAELGIEPVEVAVIDAPPDDVAAQNSAVQVIAERFRASGVEKVLLYGEAPLIWANGAKALDYRPQLLLTGTNSISAYVVSPGNDLGLLEGAVAGGPYAAPVGEPRDELEQACVDVIEERTGTEVPTVAEIREQDLGDLHIAPLTACRNLALFEAIATAAGDDLDHASFQQAGNELGEVRIPGYPDPFTFGSPPSADGDPPVYLYDWDAAEEQLVLRD